MAGGVPVAAALHWRKTDSLHLVAAWELQHAITSLHYFLLMMTHVLFQTCLVAAKFVFLSPWRAMGHGALLRIIGILFVLDFHALQMRGMAWSDRGDLIFPAAHLGRGFGWVPRGWKKFWQPGFGSHMSSGGKMIWIAGNLFAAFLHCSNQFMVTFFVVGQWILCRKRLIKWLGIHQIHQDGAPQMMRTARKLGINVVEVRTADCAETEMCVCAEIGDVQKGEMLYLC